MRDEGRSPFESPSLGIRPRRCKPDEQAHACKGRDQRAASQLKLSLLDLYPADHSVRLVSGAGTPDLAVRDMALSRLLDEIA